MGINIPNFLTSKSKNRKMIDFQDLDHLDGLSISVVSANLYKTDRDDLVMFYFRWPPGGFYWDLGSVRESFP